MLNKMTIVSIFIGLACLVVALIAKLIMQSNIFGISPAGCGQGAIIWLLLAINLQLLDKKS